MWYVCQCGQKYLSGAAEWDDLTAWQREQRIAQLSIGLVLFAILAIPLTLAYFALRYGGAALIALVGVALIPSILAAKPFGFFLLDVYEIIASVCRTRLAGRRTAPAITNGIQMRVPRPHKLHLSAVASVIAVFILGSRWIPSHRVLVSHMRDLSAPEIPNTVRQETFFAPAKLRLSRPEQGAASGSPGPEFRRVRVGPNEVDYLAEDVTVRQFIPIVPRPRFPGTYKEVHMGPDVTIRYFSSNLDVATGTRLVPADHSLQAKP